MNAIPKYPNILIPASMRPARHVDQIRESISYDIVSGFAATDIFQNYHDNNMLFSLWFSRITMTWVHGRIKSFYTANLMWVEYPEKIHNQLFYHTHVLESPIKHLWKELFGKVIDVFQHAWVEDVYIMPFESTDSKKFYHKMIRAYSDRLVDALICPNNDIVLILKKP